MFEIAQFIHPKNGTGQDRVFAGTYGAKVVLAVADGAGGLSGGAEAAEMAISSVASHAGTLNTQEECERFLYRVDAAITEDPQAGETTCVIAIITPERIVGASIGDSAGILVDEATSDLLTGAQIRKPFLGTGAVNVIGFTRTSYSGTVIVATDGLVKYTSLESIAASASTIRLEDALQQLASLVRYSSGNFPDDMAVAICRRARG